VKVSPAAAAAAASAAAVPAVAVSGTGVGDGSWFRASDMDAEDGAGSATNGNTTQTMELEGGIGSLLVNLGGDSSRDDESRIQEEEDDDVSGGDIIVHSPSTPGSKFADRSHRKQPRVQPQSQSRVRTTPVPQVVGLSTITEALELGDVFSDPALHELDVDHADALLAELMGVPPQDEQQQRGQRIEVENACADNDFEENEENREVGTSGSVDSVVSPLVAERQEAMAKTVLLLRERGTELRKALSSGKFRLALQSWGGDFQTRRAERTRRVTTL